MKKILEFLKPTSPSGKRGLILYLGGSLVYILLLTYSLNYSNQNIFLFIIEIIAWIVGLVGMVIYFKHIIQKGKEQTE